jgi:hypothetical protein
VRKQETLPLNKTFSPIFETQKEIYYLVNKSVYKPSKSQLEKFYTECVLRWRLILENFGPDIIYVPGHTNIIADALSHTYFTQTLRPL